MGDAVGEDLVVVLPAQNVGLRIGRPDQVAANIVVADARGVPHQILDGHGPVRRHQLEDRLTIPGFGLDADLFRGERRDVFGHRVGKRQFALLDQHHRGEVGDRFRHRMKREQGIRRHRLAGGDIADAEAPEIDRHSVLLDQHHRAGQFSSPDFGFEEF